VRRAHTLAWPLAIVVMIGLPLTAAAQAGGDGTVRGVVRSADTGDPLPAALVEVSRSGWQATALTDGSGAYRVTRVPGGRSVVRVRRLGYSTLEVEIAVSPGGEVVLDLDLALEPVVLDPVTVAADPPGRGEDSVPARNAALGLVGMQALETTPGLAELGLADAVRGIPGNEPADPSSVLYVRGAAADLRLVYLDGAPVYAPFPLGGILTPFAPEVLHQADIFLGGAPARYDGGLSYVMDLRTRSARTDGARLSGALDLLSARVLTEASVGERAGVLISARGLHPLAASETLGGAVPYGYTEGLIRGDVSIGESGVLSATAFANSEEIRFGGSASPDSAIDWGNMAASARYRASLGATGMEVTAALGEFSARLPFASDTVRSASGIANRMRFSADFARRLDSVQLRYGVSADGQRFQASAEPHGEEGTSVIESSGRVVGGYGEASAQLSPRVRVRGGMRLDHFSDASPVVAPRLAVSWLITERAALTLAAGRYHQFIRTPEETLLRSGALLTPGTRTIPLTVGRANHFTASLDQDLGEGIRLGVDGFFKEFSGIPGEVATQANSSGVDVWVRRTEGAMTGWVGYSLAWMWTATTMPGNAEFAGRHLLSSGFSTPLGGRTSLDLQFAYGAGLPYSTIPFPLVQREFTAAGPPGEGDIRPGSLAATRAVESGTEAAPLLEAPEAPFLRLDASISQRWNPRLGDSVYELTPYFRLLNSLGRRDALFYIGDGDAAPRPLGALPVVPVVGFEWRF
jgi:hypothetical protein